MDPLALAPLAVIVAGALAALMLEAFLKKSGPRAAALAAMLSLAAAAVLSALSWSSAPVFFGGRLVLDPFAIMLTEVFVLVAAFVVLMSLGYASRRGIDLGQLCGLLLLATAGLMIMVSSSDWLVVFLGLEVLSVASYALAGLERRDPASSEAAVKYFLMGSFAGAFFVFGLALLVGTTGELAFGSSLLPAGAAEGLPGMVVAGLGLILAGLFFKIAVAPFHMWAPDVYEGAPTPVTVFLTIVPKAAGLAVLLRALAPLVLRPGAAPVLVPALSVVAVLTMFVGNLAALRQTSVKRLLAYSAIAHSGYLLVAVVSADGPGLVFYLFAYAFMNAGAFAVLAAFPAKSSAGPALDDFAGLGRRHPLLAVSLSVFLLSLAGVPPTAGFLAKFYIFSEAVAKGHVLLAVAAVMASLVSVAYYLKVVVVMFMREPEGELALEREDPALFLVVFLCLLGVLELGLWPGNLLALIRQGVAGLF